MGFIEKLTLKDPASTRNAPTRKAVLYTVDDATGEAVPMTAGQLGGGGGGGGSDPDSAREATLAQVRDNLTQLLALLGNTDALEALATQTNALLTTLSTYNDGVEALLGSLGNNTDGLETLLTALGVKEDASTAKMEAVRALLAGTLSVNQATQAPGTLDGTIPGGTSTGASMNASGLSGVRLVIGASWTAADLSFETSTDGVTWVPLYDAYGSLVTYKAAASRSINIPVGDLLRLNRVRVRSGIPGAYVNQVATASVTLVTAPL